MDNFARRNDENIPSIGSVALVAGVKLTVEDQA